MKKRKIVMMGSIGAAVIIVLAVFPNIVSAQVISLPKEINSVISKLKSSKTINERINILQQIMENKGFNEVAVGFPLNILAIILYIGIWLISFWISLPV